MRNATKSGGDSNPPPDFTPSPTSQPAPTPTNQHGTTQEESISYNLGIKPNGKHFKTFSSQIPNSIMAPESYVFSIRGQTKISPQ